MGDCVSVQVVSSYVLFWCLGIRLQLGSVCIAAYVMMISLLTVTFLSYVCINTQILVQKSVCLWPDGDGETVHIGLTVSS